MPGPEELACVKEIVSKYLPVELERIEKHIRDEEPLSRADLCCSLTVILGIFGGQQVFPLWEEDPICLYVCYISAHAFRTRFKNRRNFYSGWTAL